MCVYMRVCRCICFEPSGVGLVAGLVTGASVIDAAVKIRKTVLGHYDINNVFLCAKTRIMYVLVLPVDHRVFAGGCACERVRSHV